MKALDCLLTIVAPRALEEDLVDRLLEHPEWVPGFTTAAAEGHGRSVRRHGIAEEVRGRSRRVHIQTVMNAVDAADLVRHLRQALPNPEVAYWIAPILEFGRFA